MSELEILKAKVVELEEKIEFLYKKFNISYLEETSEINPRIIEQLKKGNTKRQITRSEGCQRGNQTPVPYPQN